MPVGVALTQLLSDLKNEAHISTNVAHSVNADDSYKYVLNRVQAELYSQHDWPRLQIEREVALATGSRYYNYPDDLDFEAIRDFWVEEGSQWLKIDYGISPSDYNLYNSDDNFRTYPPLKWQHNTDTPHQFEVWPVPSQAGMARMEGKRKLVPMVAGADQCLLDSTMIVLYAAAEILARNKSEDAALKLQKAQQHFRALKARQVKNNVTALVSRDEYSPRLGLDFIPPGYGTGR